MREFLNKYKDLLLLAVLFCTSYFALFHLLGSYPLLDADETRYADMARGMLNSKDFITLYLDGKIFWDKPPLYFWVECLSFWILGGVNEFSVRLPCVICAAIPCFAIYFIGKKLISAKFALVSFLILITSVEYVIFAKVAILDMVLTTFITLSTLCGMLTYFVREKNKKYCWQLFYIFSAIAALAKGVPGIVIPFGTMFFIGLWKKNLKEFFKIQYLLPGIILFSIIFLPWHIMMYKIHGMEFINEYIVKHHLMRFVGSETIGRMHSPIYFIPVFLIGFLPWTLPFLSGIIEFIKEKKLPKTPDFVVMCMIGFIFTFIFFSSAKTKLITYILPLYPFAAVICASFWADYFKQRSSEKYINTSSLITFFAFTIMALLILTMKFFLPKSLYIDISSVQTGLFWLFLLSGLIGILFTIKKKKWGVFLTFALTALILSSCFMPALFNIWYKFGQNDLMHYAKYARENGLKLAAFNLWERYSLQYYYGGDVLYFSIPQDKSFKYVQTKNFNGDFKNYVMVIEHDKLKSLGLNSKYGVIKEGRRYDLIYDLD